MKSIPATLFIVICMMVFSSNASLASPSDTSGKPPPDKIIAWLNEGNSRFVLGKSKHPHMDSKRIMQASTESQGKHALATVLSCSDSRVPPEIVFDTGIMDLFVIRVAGNVANTDEIGTAEYGLCHVNTPVLVVLGHTQCGAVTAVTQEVTGHGHPLERNIPPLVSSIIPAVHRAIAEHPDLKDDSLIKRAIETNVWEVVRNLFLKSPAVRDLVKNGKAKVVGAIYDMDTGKVNWLPAEKVPAILKEVEASPDRAIGAMYEQSSHVAEKPTENKPTVSSEDQSLAPKVRELATKLDSKTAEAASELKDVKDKIDSLAAQLKSMTNPGKVSTGDTGSETSKALSSDLKNLKAGIETRFASFESSANWMFWTLGSLVVLSIICFSLLFWKLGSLGSQQEALRGKVRKAFDYLSNDIKRMGG